MFQRGSPPPFRKWSWGKIPEQTSCPSTSHRSGWALLRYEMKKDTQLLFIHLPVLGWSRERKTSYKFITKSFKISKGSYSAVAVSSCKISEATRQALPVRWKSSTNIPSKGIISGKGLGIGKVFRFPGPLRCVVQQSRRCYCSSVLNYAEQNGAVFPRKHVFTAKLLRAHPAPPFSLSCGVLHTQTSSW